LKQTTIRAAVCSALLVISSLANANNINFTNEADAIIDAELQPLILSYEQQYGDTSWGNFANYVAQQVPGYYLSTDNGDSLDEYNGLKREVPLSEFSNSDVSFTNTNLGSYKEPITQDYYSNPNDVTNYRYSQLASFGQNGFTADFSQPVTSVSIDLALTDYFTEIFPSDWGTAIPSSLPIASSSPTILNAIYKDAAGNIIGNSSMSFAYGTELNNSFSLDASASFSSIDISWDSGSLTVLQPSGKYEVWNVIEVPYSNLLTANNFTYTQAVAVPEPETYAMMMAGLGMLGFTARRKKANQLPS
jgi:hypothetical protein